MWTTLDPRSADESTDDFLDTALPAALLVAAASWLPAGVLLLGYAVRVIRAELRHDDDLPTLEDVRSLARAGLSAATVVVAYQLPALLVVAAAFALASRSRPFTPVGDSIRSGLLDPVSFVRYSLTTPSVGLTVVAAFVLAGVALVVTSYVGTLALVTFAVTDRVTSAFDVELVMAGFRSGRFRRAFVLASLLGFVGSGVAGLVAFVPVVGPFVGVFVELFVLVGALRVVADGYDESLTLQSHAFAATTSSLGSTDCGSVPDRS